MTRVLFTLLKSPFENNELKTMDAIAGNNEKGVILFQDAVYYATADDVREALLNGGFSVYAMKDELEARGYPALSAKGIEIIDYDRAVELIMKHYDKVVSL